MSPRDGQRAKTSCCIGARAIENGMTVLGVDQYAPGCFIGHSAAFAPDGAVLGALGEGDGLLTITI